MTERAEASEGVRVLAAPGGLVLGDPAGVREGRRQPLRPRAAPLAPKALAAPMHRHHREDEYTYVLEGRIGAILGDEEVVAEPGDLIFKPRNQWHTFWNAGDEPAAALEIISPAGLEQFFRDLGTMTEPPDPESLAAMAAP